MQAATRKSPKDRKPRKRPDQGVMFKDITNEVSPDPKANSVQDTDRASNLRRLRSGKKAQKLDIIVEDSSAFGDIDDNDIADQGKEGPTCSWTRSEDGLSSDAVVAGGGACGGKAVVTPASVRNFPKGRPDPVEESPAWSMMHLGDEVEDTPGPASVPSPPPPPPPPPLPPPLPSQLVHSTK